MWTVLLFLAANLLQCTLASKFDVFQSLNDAALKDKDGSDCLAVLGSMFKGKNLKKWALLMIDSTSKLQAGILSGNLQEIGAFDECIGIDEEDVVGTVKGKYCLGDVKLTNITGSKMTLTEEVLYKTTFAATNGSIFEIIPMKWSICVPDVCTASQLNSLLSEVEFPVTFSEPFCQSASTESQLTLYDNYTIIFFSLLGAVMVASTLYDYIAAPKGNSLLVAFSMLTNGRKLFQVRHDSKRLSCLEGLKVISMMWIVYGHVFQMSLSRPFVNMADLLEWYQSDTSMYVISGSLAVDTFFVMGGMVLVYTFLNMKLTRFCFNVPSFYIHRYLRLTPVLAAVVLVHVTLMDNLISGPLKPASSLGIKYCQEYWWSTLLYVQNYVNENKPCLGVAWYLMIDFQLIILSPILLIPLRKHPKLTVGFASLLTCVLIALSFYLAWDHHVIVLDLLSMNEFAPTYYTSVYTRAPAWLIGFILGCFVYQVKSGKMQLRLNKVLVLGLWMCSLAVMAACVFGGHDIISTKDPDLALTSFHAAFMRPSWALGLSWVIFACVTGNGGPINAFLSLSLFQVLARLTYCIYLTHASLMTIVTFSIRVPEYFSTFNLILDFWKYLMLTIGVSIVWTLAFESPVMALEKYIRDSSKAEEHKKGLPA